MLSVSPMKAWNILEQCWKHRETPMLHGPRGVGKTTLAVDFGKKVIKGPVWKVLLTQIEAVDLRGLVMPDPVAGVTRWLPPEFLPKTGPGLILVDEITAAETRLTKSAYQLLLERRVGEYRVPEDVFIVAA